MAAALSELFHRRLVSQVINSSDRNAVAVDTATAGLLMNELVELELGYRKIGPAHDRRRKLVEALKNNTSLVFADLSGNELGDAATSELVRALGSSVLALEIANNGLGGFGAAVPATRTLADPVIMASLTALNIGSNTVGDAGAADVARRLAAGSGRACALTYLDMRGNGITCCGAEALGAALAVNGQLQTLILRGNELEDAGATAISSGLRTNNTLQTLCLTCTSMSDHGATALSKALHINTTLRWLGDMSNNINVLGRSELEKANEARFERGQRFAQEERARRHATRCALLLCLHRYSCAVGRAAENNEKGCEEGVDASVALVSRQLLDTADLPQQICEFVLGDGAWITADVTRRHPRPILAIGGRRLMTPRMWRGLIY